MTTLDGARYLRDDQHADTMLCRLVAHHSHAIVEAGERGLADTERPHSHRSWRLSHCLILARVCT
jgi:hypothetical protein